MNCQDSRLLKFVSKYSHLSVRFCFGLGGGFMTSLSPSSSLDQRKQVCHENGEFPITMKLSLISFH